MKKYQKLANEVGALVDEKNANYGNSFDQAGEFLRLLYPEGIPPEKYGDMLCVVRIFDKLKRIATKKDAFGESPYKDIVGYGILGLERDGRLQKEAEAVSEISVSQAKETYEEEPPSAGTPSTPPVCCFCGDPVLDPIPEHVKTQTDARFAHSDCFEQHKTIADLQKKP